MFFRPTRTVLLLASVSLFLLDANCPTARSAPPTLAAEPSAGRESAVDDASLAPDDEPLGDPPAGGSSNKPPKVVNFSGVRDSPGVWVLSGKVEDENPAGLTVRFGGLSGVQGQTIITDANGNFSITVNVGNARGEVWAQTTDAQGVDSNFAYWDII